MTFSKLQAGPFGEEDEETTIEAIMEDLWLPL